MELRHLRYFKAVAERLNFSRAAAQLRVAQPALSRQIRALEDELGLKLFTRAPAVQLTDAGRVFYTHTCKVLAQVDVAVAAAKDAARGHGSGFLPAVVAEFRRREPLVQLTLHDMRFHEQLAALRGGRAHVGFVVRNVLGRATDFESMLVLRTRLMVVLPATHRLASAPLVHLGDLAKDAWAVLDEKEAPAYRTYLTQLCRLGGFTPRFGPTAATPEGLVGRVATGDAVALALETTAPYHNHHVRFVPLDTEPLELCAVWRRGGESALVRRFLAVVREVASATPLRDRPAAARRPGRSRRERTGAGQP